jgi:hypothetical protein
LENGRRAESDQEPIPEVEAHIDPFADVDGNDEGEGGDSSPTSDARMRLGRGVRLAPCKGAGELGENR